MQHGSGRHDPALSLRESGWKDAVTGHQSMPSTSHLKKSTKHTGRLVTTRNIMRIESPDPRPIRYLLEWDHAKRSGISG